MTENKRYPNYNGNVQIGEDNQKVGKIALWNNTEPTNEKSPLMTGTVEIETEKGIKKTFRVALWKFVPKEA